MHPFCDREFRFTFIPLQFRCIVVTNTTERSAKHRHVISNHRSYRAKTGTVNRARPMASASSVARHTHIHTHIHIRTLIQLTCINANISSGFFACDRNPEGLFHVVPPWPSASRSTACSSRAIT